MRVPTSAILAIAGLLLHLPAAAQQPRSAEKLEELTNPAPVQPTTTLASAAEVRVPAERTKAAASDSPKKPRAARVTTCRCGGDTPQR